MKAFVDTSILVNAFYERFPHHQASAALLDRHEKENISCAAHSLAEVHSSLTRMPGKDRISPDEALLYVDNIRTYLTVVALSEEEYYNAIGAYSGIGIAGGAIYDALIAYCALKVNAKTLYTWNVKDFKRLGPVIGNRVATP